MSRPPRCPSLSCYRLRLPGVGGLAWLIGSSADRWVCGGVHFRLCEGPFVRQHFLNTMSALCLHAALQYVAAFLVMLHGGFSVNVHCCLVIPRLSGHIHTINWVGAHSLGLNCNKTKRFYVSRYVGSLWTGRFQEQRAPSRSLPVPRTWGLLELFGLLRERDVQLGGAVHAREWQAVMTRKEMSFNWGAPHLQMCVGGVLGSSEAQTPKHPIPALKHSDHIREIKHYDLRTPCRKPG